MAEIYSTGKQSVDAIGGGLRFEQDNNRIIGRAADNKPNLIISSVPGESPLIEVALDGYDVSSATDDQKVMSSKFNMWKIIATGDINTAPRNDSITLSGNNIGYQFDVFVNTNIPITDTLTGHMLININSSFGIPFSKSGYLYNDGTNIVIFNNTYMLDPISGFLRVTQALRLISGSFTFNPYTTYIVRTIKWDICNQTRMIIPGGGAVGPLSGKYFYYDAISHNYNGTVKNSLVSSTREFLTTEYPLFPNSCPLSTFTP